MSAASSRGGPDASTTPLFPGARLGNYEILSELGKGGMGQVYRGLDLRLGREVAIKILPREMAVSADRRRRFEREARAASALNHPNIVTIYDVGEHRGMPFIAMEYVAGRTLREILEEGQLPEEQRIGYAAQIAEGLSKAHRAGIVHRDLKPENAPRERAAPRQPARQCPFPASAGGGQGEMGPAGKELSDAPHGLSSSPAARGWSPPSVESLPG